MCIEELFNKVENDIYIKMKVDPNLDIINIGRKLRKLFGSKITASKWTDTPIIRSYIEKTIINCYMNNISESNSSSHLIQKSSYIYNIVMCKKYNKPTIYSLIILAINIGCYRYYNNGIKEDWMVIRNWIDDYNIEIINNILTVHIDYIVNVIKILNNIISKQFTYVYMCQQQWRR